MSAVTAKRGLVKSKRGLHAFTVSCLLLVLTSALGWAEEGSAGTLSQLGIELEAARQLEEPLRIEACERIERALEELSETDSRAAKDAAFQLLLGEVRHERGDFEGACKAFETAKDRAGKGPLADDAAFAVIVAREARGDDEHAAKAWRKWLKKQGDSPLRAEALLKSSWNALRRGALVECRRFSDTLLADHPYFESDPRCALLRATLAYADGDAAGALTFLAKSGDNAESAFLTALCHQDLGSPIRAAASFQELIDHHPNSPLRNHARLAKANTFFTSTAFESAGEDYALLSEETMDPNLRGEALLRQAAAANRLGRTAEGSALLERVIAEHAGGSAAARAQFLLGEFLMEQGEYGQAVSEYNRVLADYFEDEVAATAQYRIGRCLEAMGRGGEATSAYQAVVSGYPLLPEAPMAAYLAGIGLMEKGRHTEAAVYFQQVLDRYLASADGSTATLFDNDEHRELLEASLCLLEYAYHLAGDLGQLSGTPHLLLERMPPSDSLWRAYALLLDADALAAQGRYSEAEQGLERLLIDFPDHPAVIPSNQLLAWIYSRQGRDELALSIEEKLLERFGGREGQAALGSSYLNMAHLRFNQKRYEEAARLYEKHVSAFADHPRRLEALYQNGLCYLRLDRAGDAIDRWRLIVEEAPNDSAAEKAWSRMANLYFLAESYPEAKQAYQGLLTHFASSDAASRAMLRLAQCEYNLGEDGSALEGYSALIDRFPGTVHAEEARQGIEMSLYRLGQQAGSEDLLGELVERFPGSHFAADAQYQIAARLLENGQHLDAAHAFRRVVSQFPAFALADRAQFLMADCFQQAGREQEAKRSLEQFTRFFPDSELAETVGFRLGMLHFEGEDYMRAAVCFTMLLDSAEPSEFSAAARFNLALCKQLLGESAGAQAEFELYRELHAEEGRLIETAYQLGTLHDNAGRPEEAVGEYGRALALDPGPELETELNYRRGACFERQGDTTAALAEYRHALSSKQWDNPFRVSAAARSAAIYEETEDYKSALSAYRDLVQHSPDPELVAAANDRLVQLEAFVQ